MNKRHLLFASAGLFLCGACKSDCGEKATPSATPSASAMATPNSAPRPTVASSSAKPNGSETPLPLPSVVGTNADRAEVARGEQIFASRLYGRLPRDTNLFLSPTSIRMALAMTYAGARNETATEMAKALVLDKVPPEKLHAGFAAELHDFATANSPISTLPPDAPEWKKQEAERTKRTIRIVNRVWGQKGRAFKPDYLNLLKTNYDAPLEQLDFAKETDKSRVRINDYVEAQTDKKIKELIAPGTLTKDTRLVLTNAVYFKASWDEPFMEGNTKEDSFFVSSSKTVRTKLMSQFHQHLYAKVGDVQVLDIPYAGGRIGMMIVLPTEKDGLAKVEQSMNDATISSWIGALIRPQNVHVTLPRFTTTGQFTLSKILPAVGMPLAFDATKADFSGIDGTKELFIGEVIHKAFVAVDENGTEAAAATAVVAKAGAAPQTDPVVEVRVDHPFLFFVRDKQTNTILFMGRVADPTI